MPVDAHERLRRPTPARAWGSALATPLAATAATLVLLPSAITFARGVAASGRLLLILLLLETLYVLAVGVSVGGARQSGDRRRATGYRHQIAIAIPVLSIFVLGAALGVPLAPFVGAQPAIGGSAVLAWGLGRLARDRVGGAMAATSSAWVLCCLLAVGLLPLSHLAPWLAARPGLSAALLALNPFVAVAHAAGFDLLRSGGLYGVLTLSDYPFRYPHPWLAPLVMTVLGLLAGRPRLHGLGRPDPASLVDPSRKEASA